MFEDILQQHKASLETYYNSKLNDLKVEFESTFLDKEVLMITINKNIMDKQLGYSNEIIKDTGKIAEEFGHTCGVMFSYNVPNNYFYNIYVKDEDYLNEYAI